MTEDHPAVPLVHHRYNLEIRWHPKRGRGVFPMTFIPCNTVIEVSPILLFRHDEYKAHGQYTALDEYTYRWRDGYALALGLGSMFNHSRRPNVGFVRDFEDQVIRYVTLRDVQPGEELCISYGTHLWFEDASEEEQQATAGESDQESSEEEAWLDHIMLEDDEA